MTRADAERYIREHTPHRNSVEDQVRLSHAMWEAGLTGGHEHQMMHGELPDALGLDLEHHIRTVVRHLTAIDVVYEAVEATHDWYHISGRDWEIIWGRVDEYLEHDIEALVDHVRDDDEAAAAAGRESVRELLARTFDVEPDAVEAHLLQDLGAGWWAREPLNAGVEVIRAHPEIEKRDTYGEVIIQRGHSWYHLTGSQVERYERG